MKRELTPVGGGVVDAVIQATDAYPATPGLSRESRLYQALTYFGFTACHQMFGQINEELVTETMVDASRGVQYIQRFRGPLIAAEEELQTLLNLPTQGTNLLMRQESHKFAKPFWARLLRGAAFRSGEDEISRYEILAADPDDFKSRVGTFWNTVAFAEANPRRISVGDIFNRDRAATNVAVIAEVAEENGLTIPKAEVVIPEFFEIQAIKANLTS